MAQRKSGYVRQENELYCSPPWIVDALCEHVCLQGLSVWEPAAASGQLADALVAQGATVWESDLISAGDTARMASRTSGADFLHATRPPVSTIEVICTNPPYGSGGRTAVAFIEKGLELMRQPGSRVRLLALLLSVDFDSASGRTHLFVDCAEFALKVVLLRRIKWFESWAVYLDGVRVGRIDAKDEDDAWEQARAGWPGRAVELKVSGPSTNHAWYCYDRPAVQLAGYPRVAYAPRASAAESVLEGL